MQSAMWMPLALLALHHLAIGPSYGPASDGAPTGRRVAAGASLGAALAMQALSGLYYFMFLVIVLFAMIVVLFLAIPRDAKWTLGRGLVIAALVAGAVIVPYARPYSRARAVVGPRGANEVAQFSARPGDYLAGGASRWWSASHDGEGRGEEHILSPGLLAPALAIAGLWPPLDAWRVASGVALAVAVDASLGTNGRLFPAAQRVVPALDGLRVPARFAVLVLLLVAMLAAVGLTRLVRARTPGVSRAVSAVAIGLCAIDFWSAPLALRHPVTRHTDLTRFLARLPAGTVVLHLPVPRTSELWLHETKYQYLSTFHWQPLVNGYSGFPPPVYLRTLDVLRRFPDEESIARLRRLEVRYVVLHPDLFGEPEYARIASALALGHDFEFVARFPGAPLASAVFRLKPEATARTVLTP
jgi:hypothetical protein